MITSPHEAVTDNPAALFDRIMLEMTGALFIHDMAMMPIPITRAMRRERHGLVRRGREARHVWGVTAGDGSEDHAQLAIVFMNGLVLIALYEAVVFEQKEGRVSRR